MPICTPPETYSRIIKYGMKKVEARSDQIFIQSIAAGFWVALYGHCCSVLAGAFYDDAHWLSRGLTKLVYATIFPGAFAAIIFTGAELFTGNTVTMFMCVFAKRTNWWNLCRVWLLSAVGNSVGAILVAYLISTLSGSFEPGTYAREYLTAAAFAKTNYSFGQVLLLGIGCNSFVCLGLWSVVTCDDAAGKVLAMWFPIAAFAAGGFEHIIANMYTLSLALFEGMDGITWNGVILYNWFPVLIGNIIAGTLVTGALWWYNFGMADDLSAYTNQELVETIARRMSYAARESLLVPGGSPGTPSARPTHGPSIGPSLEKSDPIIE